MAEMIILNGQVVFPYLGYYGGQYDCTECLILTPPLPTCFYTAAPLSSSAMTSSTGSFGSCTTVFGGMIQREQDQQRSAFVPVTGSSSRRRHRGRARSGGTGSVEEGK
jgi:hypothetical protein